MFVGRVDTGSPAERCGLRTGDLILLVNGQGLRGFSRNRSFLSAPWGNCPACASSLEILRYDSSTQRYGASSLMLHLVRQPTDTDFFLLGIGATITYYIQEVPYGSLAQRLGLESGDFVERVNGKGFATADELDDMVKDIGRNCSRISLSLIRYYPLGNGVVSTRDARNVVADAGCCGSGCGTCFASQIPPKPIEFVLGICGSPAALIEIVHHGFPAERAGLRPGDLILRFNGLSMRDFETYRSFLEGMRDDAFPDGVSLDILRYHADMGRYLAEQVTLRLDTAPGEARGPILGITALATYFVLVVSPSGKAHDLDLVSGDFIETVNGDEFRTPLELDHAVERAEREGRISLHVRQWTTLEDGSMQVVNERTLGPLRMITPPVRTVDGPAILE